MLPLPIKATTDDKTNTFKGRRRKPKCRIKIATLMLPLTTYIQGSRRDQEEGGGAGPAS